MRAVKDSLPISLAKWREGAKRTSLPSLDARNGGSPSRPLWTGAVGPYQAFYWVGNDLLPIDG